MKMSKCILGFVCLTVSLLLPGSATSEVNLTNDVVGCGGSAAETENLVCMGTAGQIAVGRVSGPTYIHEIGFWAQSTMVPTDVPPPDAQGLPERIEFRFGSANPIGSAGSITFAMPFEGGVHVALYDVSGRMIQVLHDGSAQPGIHRVSVDSRRLASGVYYCRMTGPHFVKTLRLMVLR